MLRNRFLASTLALTALLGTACSDSALLEPSAMDLAPSLSAAAGPYGVDAIVVRLAPGATHQLTATKSANGMEVPTTSITWSSSDPSVATVSASGLVSAVAPGEATVSANRGSHSEQVTVIVDGCGLRSLPVGSLSETISATDCVRGTLFADIYAVDIGVGEVARFEATGIADGLHGIKVPGATFVEGVYQVVPMGFGVRLIGNGNPLHAVAAAASFGSYTITRSAPNEAHDCDDYHFVLPGSSFATTLTPANSCAVDVAFPSIPEAMGMPLNTHWFNMYVQGGVSYTVTITGVSDTFNPALTVFAGAGNVFQSAPDGNPAPSTRTVTFSRANNGYVGIEVATGRFIGGLLPENWVIESGAYTMTVSQ